jgi:hypothetical protein
MKHFKRISSDDDNEVDDSLVASLKEKADKFQKKLGPIMAKVKIIIATFQILSVSLQSFQVSMPGSYTRFISGMDILMIDMINVIPVGCIKRLNYVDTLIIKTLFPPCFVGLLFVCFMIELTIRNRNLLKIHISDHRQLKAQLLVLIRNLKFKYMSAVLLFSYLYLPGLTVAIFQTFICQNIDPGSSNGDYYLTADYSLNCNSPTVKFARVWAGFMIVIYPIGITLLYFCLLYKKRYEIMHRHDIESRNTIISANSDQQSSIVTIKFLYESYKPQYWYFEIVETGRRLMLTGVLSVAGEGTSGQVVFGILLAVLYTKIYGYYQPYELQETSVVAELAQYQIFFSFFGTLVVQNALLEPFYNSLIGGLMIVLNLSASLLSVYYEYIGFTKENSVEPNTNDKTDDTTNDIVLPETPNPLLHRIDVSKAPTIVERAVEKYIDMLNTSAVVSNRNGDVKLDN